MENIRSIYSRFWTKWQKCSRSTQLQNGKIRMFDIRIFDDQNRFILLSNLRTSNSPEIETMLTKDQVLTWLEEVKDPEIPVLSLIDLGVITDVTVSENGKKVKVEMTPTFAGCP